MERKSINGLVTDAAGKPVQDAVIMIVSAPTDFNDIASISGEDGAFSLSNITVPGSYVLQVQHEGRSIKKQVEILNADSTIRISL